MIKKNPLILCIIVEENGKIISAHCDCIVGLDETHLHIASFLWAIESALHMRDCRTNN